MSDPYGPIRLTAEDTEYVNVSLDASVSRVGATSGIGEPFGTPPILLLYLWFQSNFSLF